MARSGKQIIQFDLALDQIVDGLRACKDISLTLPEIIAPRSKYGAMRMGRREFLAWLDATAKTNPDNFMHLYKWGTGGRNLVGDPQSRLFTLAFRNTNSPESYAIIEYLVNNTPVRRPDPNQETDQRKRQVTFIHQARILEEWEGAISVPRSAKWMVFWGEKRDREGVPTGEEGWIFVKRAHTNYYQTRGQLTEAWNTFWTAIGSKKIPQYIGEHVERELRDRVEPHIKAARVSNITTARNIASLTKGGGVFNVTYRGKKLTPYQIQRALDVKKPTARARAIAKAVVRKFDQMGVDNV